MASNQVISNPSPVSKMPRSVFHHQVPGFASMNYGRIYPVFVKYQEPRSKISMEDVKTLIRGATPIAPTMGNSSMELHAFSVPWRIVWNYTKQFFGENDSSAWTQQTLYNKPTIQLRIGDLVIAPLNFTGNTTGCTAKNCSIYDEIDDGNWSVSRDLVLLGRIDDDGFFTDNDSEAWEDQVNGLGLFIDIFTSDVYGPNKLADYMGLHPIPKDADFVTLQKFWNGVVCSGNDILEVDALPFRAFFSVVNYYYRDQNYQAPYLFSKDNEKLKLTIHDRESNRLPMPYDFMEYRPSGNVVLTNPDAAWDYYEGSAFCPPASRLHDPFSTIVPEPLKGEQYDLLAVAGLAPVGGVGTTMHSGDPLYIGSSSASAVSRNLVTGAYTGALLADGTTSVSGDLSGVNSSNLFADLTKTTGITLEKFREFVVLNQWNEKAVKGTRYAEIIAEFYGGKVDPALLDEPRYLGGVSIPISSWQVTQSAPNSDGSGVGDLGAFTHTLDRSGLFTFGFEEASILIVCAVSRVEHMYAQQVDPHWFRQDRYDEHYPLFDGIGYQPLEKKIPYLPFAFLAGEQGSPTLGFQEAYWEERFQLGNSAGVLNASNPFALRYFLYNELPTEHPTGSPEYLSAFRDAEIVDNTLQLGSQASLLAQQLLVNFSFDYYEAKQIKKSGGDPGIGRI